MSRRSEAASASLALLAVAAFGCQPSKSPEQACKNFLRAVAEGDAPAIFEQLSQPTQWAMFAVQKHQTRMRDLVRTSYPATEQAAALSRLYAAEADSGRDLFSRLYGERYAATFSARLGSGAAQVEVLADGAAMNCRRTVSPGPPFHFVRDRAGRYALSELASEWEGAQLRATHDLATVEKNAEIYRHASGTGPAPAAR